MTNNLLPKTFLETALEAVSKAEEIIMGYYNNGVEIQIKGDMTPVTMADKKAEEIIRDHISKVFPDHGFMGEEFGDTDTDKEFVWIIDPIDGTKSFIKNIPLWGTQLALRQGDDIVVGVTNVPTLKERFYAQKGQGAFKNNSRIHASSTNKMEDVFFAYGNLEIFLNTDSIDKLLSLVKNTNYSRGFGDLWGHGIVADGRADFMIEAHVSIWDIAPAIIIVEEAGGKVTNWKGEKFVNKQDNIVSSNGILHEKILEILNG